jgi:hypothetical protein
MLYKLKINSHSHTCSNLLKGALLLAAISLMLSFFSLYNINNGFLKAHNLLFFFVQSSVSYFIYFARYISLQKIEMKKSKREKQYLM